MANTFNLSKRELSLAKVLDKSYDFDPKGALHVTSDRIEVTDGHVAFWVKLMTTPEREVLIPRTEALEALSWVRKEKNGDGLVQVDPDGRFEHQGKSLAWKPLDAKYPDIPAVVPRSAPSLALGLGVKVLETIIQAAKDWGSPTVVFGFRSAKDPFDVRFASEFDDEAVLPQGIAMPFRIDEKYRKDFREDVLALWKRTNQDDPAIERPLSGADFVQAIGDLLETDGYTL